MHDWLLRLLFLWNKATIGDGEVGFTVAGVLPMMVGNEHTKLLQLLCLGLVDLVQHSVEGCASSQRSACPDCKLLPIELTWLLFNQHPHHLLLGLVGLHQSLSQFPWELLDIAAVYLEDAYRLSRNGVVIPVLLFQ